MIQRTIVSRFYIENEREMISFWRKGREKDSTTSSTVSRFKRDHAALWEKEVSRDYEDWKAPTKPAKAKAVPVVAAAPAPAPAAAPKKRGKKAA